MRAETPTEALSGRSYSARVDVVGREVGAGTAGNSGRMVWGAAGCGAAVIGAVIVKLKVAPLPTPSEDAVMAPPMSCSRNTPPRHRDKAEKNIAYKNRIHVLLSRSTLCLCGCATRHGEITDLNEAFRDGQAKTCAKGERQVPNTQNKMKPLATLEKHGNPPKHTNDAPKDCADLIP